MSIKAYKGFNKDMTCRGFQYEQGKEYTEDKAKLCESGFHACEAPLSVWGYYPPIDGNRYCEVEQDGEIDKGDDKTVSTKIKIGKEIGIARLVDAHVSLCAEQTSKDDHANAGSSSGDYAKIGSSGDYAQIGSSGYYAKISSSGKNAVIAAIGYKSRVRAALGAFVCLTEYKLNDDMQQYICVGMQAIHIDGKQYKPDTWYTMRNGEVVEA